VRTAISLARCGRSNRAGRAARWFSDLLPHVAELADELCFVHSLTSKTKHARPPANATCRTGFTLEGYPAWVPGLATHWGSENRNLPAYVAIPDPRGVPQQGPSNWTNGFLPAVFQGTVFNADTPDRQTSLVRVGHENADRATRDLLKLLNEEHLKRHPEDSELSARVAAYELAARMQLSAPEVSDLSGEKRRHAPTVWPGRSEPHPGPASVATVCWRGDCSNAAFRFVTLYNGAFRDGRGRR